MSDNIYYAGKNLRVESFPHGIKKIILTRPDIRNAFHAEMIAELTSVLTEMSHIADPAEMRLLILAGEGKVFCAGADLAYMQEQAKQTEAQNRNDAQILGKLFLAVADFPAPVLCVAQGAAIGGGLGLVACADFTLATDDSVYATTEVLLGIVPAVISPYIIRKIGVGHASTLMLTGKRMTAQECLNFGLVNKVTELKNVNAELEKLIHEFLRAGPCAARRTKALIKNAFPLPDEAQFEFTVAQIAAARSSEEGKAGLNSFFTKKPPFWCEGLVTKDQPT